jgi:hypothetical protein
LLVEAREVELLVQPLKWVWVEAVVVGLMGNIGKQLHLELMLLGLVVQVVRLVIRAELVGRPLLELLELK